MAQKKQNAFPAGVSVFLDICTPEADLRGLMERLDASQLTHVLIYYQRGGKIWFMTCVVTKSLKIVAVE